jgi:hypothetical protein
MSEKVEEGGILFLTVKEILILLGGEKLSFYT